VTLSLRAAGSRVRLQVMDTGPGIASADLPHLFDRFYRSDRARAGEGTGLGLAIGRWIAEAHGGQITAGNRPEGGAVFTVTLPARSVQQPEPSVSVDRKAGRPAS
jgi:signal transduction histidine kinase